MTRNTKRAIAAGGTFVIAGVVNVATGMLTQEWAAAWLAATAVLLLLGGAFQAWVTWSEREDSGGEGDNGGEGDGGGGRGRGTQTTHGTRIGGDAEQSMSGPGDQAVTDSKISGSLIQRQGDGTSS
jgi:hypothetical protein